MSDTPEEPGALVPAEARALAPAVSPPPLRFARSLDEADPRALVFVDRKGHVRSPVWYRASNAIAYGLAVTISVAGALVYAMLFGPAVGLAAGAFFAAVNVLAGRRRRRWQKVVALIVDGRLDEAEAICRRVLERRFVPRAMRAAAHQNLSVIATRRGRFEEALVEVRAAIRLRHRTLRKGVFLDMLAYAEIGLLAKLGRTGEARGRLEARGAAPEGEYLKIMHWTADLTVQFCEGRSRLDEEQLWERSRRALQIASASQLLGLCAWASAEAGDQEMSDHLLAEAIERATPETATTFPTLWSWVEGRRARLGEDPAS